MIVSTLLLDQNNCYVNDKGELPRRPAFDKELLQTLCTGQTISNHAAVMLPPSILDVVGHISSGQPTIGITIPEIDALTDLLLVTRSSCAVKEGKTFRMDNFKLITEQGEIEIWKRK